jgi:glycosyltransferase involved in cell wall biosynthesis
MLNRNIEITIPVLNEESNLENGINELMIFLENKFPKKYNWSIMIADNGSGDRTGEIGQKLAKESEKVNYLRLDKRGVGLALKSSWSKAESAVVGYMDLDLATDLECLSTAMTALFEDNYDIVYGTRLHKKSRVFGRSLKREITSRIFNFIVKKYLNVSISDGMCGFKFLKQNKLDFLLANGAVSDGWFFSTELLVISQWHDLKIFELPVKWIDSSDSKVKIFSLSLEYLQAMKQLKKRKP